MSATVPVKLREALKRFGFDAFREGQRELVEAALAGRDALGVLPTGGGKSLTYQLPATLLPGLTVVVSPLIALMKDQVDALNRHGHARAVALHSNLSAAEAQEALREVHAGEAALLYVSPERLESEAFRRRIAALKPKLFVIDEAHCVSQWGYDFRPSYLRLRPAVEAARPCPVLALTATAPPAVRDDIVKQLGLRKALVQVGSLDRPNLRFEVHPCGPGEKPRRLKRILKDLDGQGSQIVYVGRRKDAESVAADLNQVGLRATCYHAGMSAAARKTAQEQWLSGRRPIAVATVAFGMGIDKADVRAVIHYQHPPALEAYYQEAGRAGRDGKPAQCILLYAPKDTSLIRFFLRNRYPAREEVQAVYASVDPSGSMLEELRAHASELTPEQLNVALLALHEQDLVWHDDNGRICRAAGNPQAQAIDLNAMFARKNADYARLDAMLEFAAESNCLRKRLLHYFGETFAADYRCGNCSACSGGTAEVGHAAARDEARRVLERHRAVFQAAWKLNKATLARFLYGSDAKSIPAAWHALPGFGALNHLTISTLHTIAEAVLDEDRREQGSASASPKAQSPRAEVPGGGAAFWRGKDRAFTREELQTREVPRKHGVLMLELFDANPGRFAPSLAVAVLRGGAQSQESRTAELQALPQWAVLKGVRYEDLLADLLAMYAKGYLEPHGGKGKRLALSLRGREALHRTRPAKA
ncbi:MAG: ATP-dependent DNA helicase RecQ [Planctomycetes bacterium]|nr:ATP-dependent DNA helicase RecQ [Planctomycetota bacterium]